MKKFLINEYGKEQGEKIYKQQQERLYILLKQNNRNSNSQLKTLKKYILPPIALYKVLQEDLLCKETALKVTKKYSFQNANKFQGFILKFERFPSFFKIFRTIVNKALKADNWELTYEKNDDEAIIFTIERCLWYDSCVKYNCPEIYAMFCETDDICYGSMKKITFKRTQTLGTGGNHCDFKYINNNAK